MVRSALLRFGFSLQNTMPSPTSGAGDSDRRRPDRRLVPPSWRPVRKATEHYGDGLWGGVLLSFPLGAAYNPLCFHQYNGEMELTCLFFNNIMESRSSDIFSTCVFNNIMEVTFIFPPPRFLARHQREVCNLFAINNLIFCGRRGKLAKCICNHEHNGETLRSQDSFFPALLVYSSVEP